MIKFSRQIARLILGVVVLVLALTACRTPLLPPLPTSRTMPPNFLAKQDTTSNNIGKMTWQTYFKDAALISLIDTALRNNQELNIALQEIEIARNEIRARKGEYLPFVSLRGSMGADKVGRYTQMGASQANIEIQPSTPTPEPLPDFLVGAYASWEVDIWHRLRNARKSAVNRYLATIEGRNFAITNLIAEIATAYYELMALDNQLLIIKQNIQIQNSVFEIIKVEKEASRVTELAVRRFQAQVLNTRGLQFDIEQQIVETENKLRFLIGNYQGTIIRNSATFSALEPDSIYTGIPTQLIENRPDVRQAELTLMAAKLDVQSARANFYPSLKIGAGLGFNAYNPVLLLQAPQSLLFNLAGELAGPLVNRNAIKAMYSNANAKQIQAVYQYQRTLLNAYREVSNQVSNLSNLQKRYALKQLEVEALQQSITISGNLFRSARADYMEVLLTQRDAQESRIQLVETKKKQLGAIVQIYRALGGGWR